MKSIKKNIYIIGAFAFLIIALAISGVVIYLNRNVQNSDSTAIGHIYLGNMTEEERKGAIQKGINEWEKTLKKGGGYTITYQNMTMHFYITDYIYYNEEMTMRNLQEGSADNRAYMLPLNTDTTAENSLERLEEKIDDFFFGNYTRVERPSFYFGQFINGKKGELCYDILEVAGQFYSNYEFDLYDYLAKFPDEKHQEVSTVTLNTKGYEDNVKNIIAELDAAGKVSHESDTTSGGIKINEYTGIKVVDGETDKDGFSLLQYTEKMDLSARELSILGTGMTVLAMDTNFTNIRRNSDREMPSYTYYNRASTITVDGVAGTDQYGIATRISRPNNEDLTFFNSDSFDYNIKIEASADNSELKFTLIGPKSTRKYTITAEVTTKNYNITPPEMLPSESFASEVLLTARAEVLKGSGYVELTAAEALEQLGVIVLEGEKLFYYLKEGENGAEVSYYRSYNRIVETTEEAEDGTIKYVVSTVEVKDEKIFKDAAYPAAAQESNYIILSVDSVSELL